MGVGTETVTAEESAPVLAAVTAQVKAKGLAKV